MSGRSSPLFDGDDDDDADRPDAAGGMKGRTGRTVRNGLERGRLVRIVCASCETIMGVVGDTSGPAYCAECLREAMNDDDDDDAGDGDGGVGDGDVGDGVCEDCAGPGMDDDDGGNSGPGEWGDGGVGEGGECSEQARRLRHIMHSLSPENGAAPTRRQVVDGMLGDGAWGTAEAAEQFLDLASEHGVIYEPDVGRLRLIDEE